MFSVRERFYLIRLLKRDSFGMRTGAGSVLCSLAVSGDRLLSARIFSADPQNIRRAVGARRLQRYE